MYGHIERGSDKLWRASSTFGFPDTIGDHVAYPYRLANYDSAPCSLGYYRLLLKIQYGENSGILNYEYE